MEYDYDSYRYWWKSKDSQVHEDVFRYLETLDQAQSYKSADNMRHMRLYGNYEMVGLDAYTYNKTDAASNLKNRVTLNVIQSMVDTVVSKICKNKPRPLFLTSQGDWALQRKAKNLTKFVEGIFNSTEFYSEAKKAFKESCIFGTGAIKIYTDDGEIRAERVFIEELKVDDAEALYGKPRQIHQVKYIHKDVLIQQFPDNATEIVIASDSAGYRGSQYTNAKDMVRVVESWHLPSGKNADDGKHTITIRECTLYVEEYKKTYFPFVFFHWTERPLGFWGQGLSEQLQGIQLEINKILRTIQVSMHLVSIPKIFLEAGSKIVTTHLNNKIGGIIKYAGTRPTSDSLGSIPPELFTHLRDLYQRAYEITGVSQLSAQSTKPTGLDSGKALREYSDLESERFLDVSQRYEKAFLDAAEIMVDTAKDLYEDYPELDVKVKGKRFVEKIKWKDVDMEEDKYVMDIYPTSFLSKTPSGRLQDVQELLQSGFISKEEGMKLLDFPDLEAETTLINSDITNIEKQLDDMLLKGEYESPEPYQNLELAIKMAQRAYLKFKSEGAPESRLELLRRYMEDAQGLIAQSQEPQPIPRIPAEASTTIQTEVPTEAGTQEPLDVTAQAPQQALPEDLSQIDLEGLK